ncbi:MAG: Enterobactin exporter EntS [Anaerolineae bacterium]|nr:Enterobactin exporter EntS [Anaerolineae bacterium]
MTMARAPDPYASLRLPEFRYWLTASVFSTLANRALAVAIGFQIYELTRDPLALGILGLVEAIPAVGLSLFGGHFADRHDRRAIVLVTRAVSVGAALALAALSADLQALGVAALYAVVFVAGIARGFADPALSAFEAQVIPRELYVNAATWSGSVGQATAILGPALGGFVYAWLGATNTYLMIALFLALAWTGMALIKPKPMPPFEAGESIWQSIRVGVSYVFHHQILVGSMALDLFAVLFGGAIALLPVFAADILQVGPQGLGLLVAAPSVGALAAMLWSTRHPPVKRAGKILFGVVAGFGVSIIVFALSRNFYLSLLALALSGMFDGVSMIIRETILRLYSPEHLRGRIAAVQWVFIGSSNEIGAFESGVAARVLGAVPAVWLGGVITLIVVGVTFALAPQLRAMDLRPEFVPTLQELEQLEVENMTGV